MEEMLSGKLSQHDFFEKINAPYGEGGVGLYSGTAVRFMKKIIAILKEVSGFLKDRKNINNPQKSLPMVNMLREFLLEEYQGNLNSEQINLLEKGIHERLSGTMNAVQFSEFLDRPLSEGGVGLNTFTAENLSERLSLIMVQTYEIS
jgi:hypothetical protein